jgi:undecaprenyl-diphosphatase
MLTRVSSSSEFLRSPPFPCAVVAAALAARRVHEIDAAIFRWLHDAFSSGHWLTLMRGLTVLGSGWGALVVVPFLSLRRTRRAGLVLSAVFALTAALVFVLKALIRRRRPYLALDVPALVFEAPTDYSYPSGHAAGSFAFASFVAVLAVRAAVDVRKGYAVGIGVTILAALIALSRVALGVHYPADVAAGAVLGSTIGAAGAHLYWQRRAR